MVMIVVMVLGVGGGAVVLGAVVVDADPSVFVGLLLSVEVVEEESVVVGGGGVCLVSEALVVSFELVVVGSDVLVVLLSEVWVVDESSDDELLGAGAASVVDGEFPWVGLGSGSKSAALISSFSSLTGSATAAAWTARPNSKKESNETRRMVDGELEMARFWLWTAYSREKKTGGTGVTSPGQAETRRCGGM